MDASVNQDLKNLFYQGQDNDDSSSPLKPPRPGTSSSAQAASPAQKPQPNLNPFNQPNSNRASKSIPEILELLGKIDFDSTFRRQPEMKLNKLYTLLTSELGLPLSLSDLKNLNRFLMSRQAQGQDEDLEFMSRDESVVDLPFL